MKNSSDAKHGNTDQPWVRSLPTWLIAIVLVGYVSHQNSLICLWLAVSFFLYVSAIPGVEWLKRKGISGILSTAIMISVVAMLLALIGLGLYSIFPSLTSEFGLYKKVMANLYTQVTHTIDSFGKSMTTVQTTSSPVVPEVTRVEVVENVPAAHSATVTTVVQGMGVVATYVSYAVLSLILAFFLVAERKSLGSAFARLYPGGNRATRVWGDITRATTAYFLGNLILTLASYPVFAIVFAIFDLKGFALLALVAAVLNQIPFLGAPLAAAVPVLSLMARGGSINQALVLLAATFAVHFVLANLVTPKILGSKVDLNATTSTVALVLWGALWGAGGLFIAVPLTAMIKILFQHSGERSLQWLALLMSDDPDSLLYAFSKKVKLN